MIFFKTWFHRFNSSQQKHARVSGFTLIETLMVMLILGTVMLAASGLANTVLISAGKNQNVVVATYLAQECTELSRNVRDNAWRQNRPWMCPFVLPGESDPLIYDGRTNQDVFGIAPGSASLPGCSQDLGVLLPIFSTIDDATLYRKNGILGYDNSDPSTEETHFKRYITVDNYTTDPSDNSGEIELTCHVDWSDGGVSMTQRLTSWRQA